MPGCLCESGHSYFHPDALGPGGWMLLHRRPTSSEVALLHIPFVPIFSSHSRCPIHSCVRPCSPLFLFSSVARVCLSRPWSSSHVWLSQLLVCSVPPPPTPTPTPVCERVRACARICERVHPCWCVCSLHPALAPINASNMSSMLHDSVQALAGDAGGHGVPLGQTGL